MTELELHRQFYSAWKEFHAKAKSTLPRKIIESAAQRLVDLAHTIDRYNDPAIDKAKQ